MWETTVDGRALHFHLAGINNQNFIMRDEETGSWWQQVSGECVLGPLKGRRLKLFDHDELTYATWKSENAGGRVLRPDPKVAAANNYAPADWERRMQRVPVATTLADANAVLPARTLVVGVEAGGSAKAYPFDALEKQNPIIDTIGTTPVLVLLGEDGKSVRVFDRRLDAHVLEFFLRPGSPNLIDTETGSEWDFTGAATSGALAGRKLERVQPVKDYWFDWKGFHPETGVYLLGER
ncbi:MAG: hypothetical protein QOC61_2074 [Acidobacteriota bacterium]|nr:hypothetical protein [Acidobacteriota bacterium]MDT5263070.1 hypothetical protein [Acidobacteriota bacterium]